MAYNLKEQLEYLEYKERIHSMKKNRYSNKTKDFQKVNTIYAIFSIFVSIIVGFLSKNPTVGFFVFLGFCFILSLLDTYYVLASSDSKNNQVIISMYNKKVKELVEKGYLYIDFDILLQSHDKNQIMSILEEENFYELKRILIKKI